MRQAGRYLPEYRQVRDKSDFLTMCRTPEIATEITLQPIDIIGVDAAIIFSDILVIPEAMGLPLRFSEGTGPILDKPLRNEKDFDELLPVNVEEDLGFVLEALRMTRRELQDRVPLIGFAGAPWTLAAYMVEGGGSRNFIEIKKLLYARPDLLKGLLARLADAVADYLCAQIKAGAQVVQIFDSWAGMLTPPQFREFALPYLKQIVKKVTGTGAPVIVFARDAGHSFAELSEIGADVLGVSWTEDLAVARKAVGDKVVLQGNLDPCALFAPVDRLKNEVEEVLAKAGQEPAHIFNLGHGILPPTPVAHTQAMVDFVRELSPAFHQKKEE